MRKQQLRYVWLLVLTLLLVLTACRQKEETPPVPTAMPTAVLLATPTTAPTPRPTATAVPIAAVALTDIDWPPQLVYSSPARGEEALLDGAITLRFDQPMDRDSVEAAFAIAEVDGSAVQGAFTWTREDTVIFTPRSLKRQADYKVQVADTAVSRSGQPLLAPIELDLRTVGYLDVSQVIPSDAAAEVETDGAITVLFNRPVVPLVSSGQQAGLPQPLSISPAVSGAGEWVSTSIYRFTPDVGFDGATSYRVTIGDGLTDITGDVLDKDFTWSFTTRSPQIVSVDPPNGATGIEPTRPLTITFNMPMDRALTEASVLLPGVGVGNTAVAYSWSDGDRVLTLTPQQRLELETEYQIVVGSLAAAASGEATLGVDVVNAFTTVPFPAVLSTYPASNTLADQYAYGVSISFASPMDMDTLDGRILIDPAPPRVAYYWNEYDNSLYLNFPLERNGRYRLTIPATAADPYGNTLGQDYTWQFDTPDYDPIASFNLPQGSSQLSTSFVTQVDIIHRNVSNLNVELFDVGLPLNLLVSPYDLYDYRPNSQPRQSWDIPLANTNGVTALPLAGDGTLPTGVYFLNLSAPEVLQEMRYWQNQRHLLIVADTNIIVKEMFPEVHVWVTDIASGRPAAGRNLAFYNVRGVPIGTAVSDSSGFASINRSERVDYLEGVVVVSNQPGQVGFGAASSTWNASASNWELGLTNIGYSPPASTFAYLYTDRPIYRPGDTVYFKGIVRDNDYGRYALPTPTTVRLSLNPAFYYEEQSLSETFTFGLLPDGSFNGEYTLPENIALGTYQFSLDGQDYNTYRTFTVAEYRKPEFLVSMTPAQTEALRGDTVDVTLEASYFFGGPAADLTLNWSVYEDTYYLNVPGPYYSFGDGGSFFYEDTGPFFGGGSYGRYLSGGEAKTDANGRFTLTLPADLLKDADIGSRTVTVEANVMDLSNFPVSSRASVTFHAANAYVGVKPASYVTRAGTETAVDLLTVNWEGQPIANQSIEVIFYRRDWTSTRSNDGGAYRTFWEPVDTEISRAQARSDNQGKASASFTPENGGSYIAVATVTDSGGRSQTSSAHLWVTDQEFIGWRTAQRERRMDLVPDKQEYQPGDTAQILVQSPFAGPVQAWVTIDRGRLLEQKLVTLQGNGDILDIPIPAAYAPNVYVSVVVVKPVTPGDETNPYADVRLGVTELVVSPEQLVLNVELTPQQDSFAPGETAVYDIRVTDYAGRPVPADLSLALVDLAVLTLKDDNAPPIQEAFYARQPYYSQVGGGFFISGEGLEVEIPLEGGGRGGGGGDATEAALARAIGDEEERARRDFPDTAFWRASVTTDANGQVRVEVPLPDSLTTWRLSSKAISADSLAGQTSVDVQVSLPLLLRPVTPRFFTVGDALQLGTIVNNNTGSAIEATVSLEADGLSGDLADQTVNVPANGQTIVRWNVIVDDVEFADLTFRVSGGGYRDVTKPGFGVGPDQLVPVYRYDAEDVVGTSGVLDEAGRRVEAILLPPNLDARRGSVDVTLSPSLAAALIESLAYQENMPYETSCAHAIADRLLPNAVTARALRDLNLGDARLQGALDVLIPQQIADIEKLALPDGGWGWCYSSQRNDWLTAYILFALIQASNAGYAVPEQVLSDGGAYLLDSLQEPEQLRSTYEVDRQIFFLYVLYQLGRDVPDLYDRHVAEQRDLMSPYAKALLADIYNSTDYTPANLATLLADLNDSAVVSATGAHWESNDSQPWQNLNSDIRNTAIVIYALSLADDGNPWLPGAVRWLMVARQAQSWPTSHETAWSILALTAWMRATGELDANYNYNLAVNLETAAQGQFTPDNVTTNERTSIPVSDLAADAVNFFDFQRGEGDGRLYYTLHLDSFQLAQDVTAVSRGMTVERVYYDAACNPETETCEPLTSINAGQQVRVQLTLVTASSQLYLVLRDPLPAGAEAIDPGLNTSAGGTNVSFQNVDQPYRYGYWGWWYFNRVEFRDEQVVFFADYLPAGTYQYTYYLQATIPGDYQVMPATARQEFFPEVFGRSAGFLFTIN